MFKILNLFTSIKNISIYSAILIVITSLTTIHIHNKFIDANKVKTVNKQLENALEAPNTIIKFQQDLGKTNAKKDACFNTNMPPDVIRLLK